MQECKGRSPEEHPKSFIQMRLYLAQSLYNLPTALPVSLITDFYCCWKGKNSPLKTYSQLGNRIQQHALFYHLLVQLSLFFPPFSFCCHKELMKLLGFDSVFYYEGFFRQLKWLRAGLAEEVLSRGPLVGVKRAASGTILPELNCSFLSALFRPRYNLRSALCVIKALIEWQLYVHKSVLPANTTTQPNSNSSHNTRRPKFSKTKFVTSSLASSCLQT